MLKPWFSLYGKCVLAVLIVCPAIFAQSSSSSSSSSSTSDEPVIPRIWGGLLGSYTPFKQVSTKSYTDSAGDVFTSTPANGQAGVGASINLRAVGGFWLNFGVTYRFGGYDTSDAVNDSAYDTYIYRGRARYYDFPLLVRYSGAKYRWNKYAFYELGGALRHASVTTTSGAANYDDGIYCCAPASPTTIHNNVEGAVIGTGLIGRDPFGIIVTPEVRYTRWMGSTFESSSVTGERNQLEVTLTFGF